MSFLFYHDLVSSKELASELADTIISEEIRDFWELDFIKITEELEGKFEKKLLDYFDKQREAVLSFALKEEKSVQKDIYDMSNWTFDRQEWDDLLQSIGEEAIHEIYLVYGPIVFEKLRYIVQGTSLMGGFDVLNPEVLNYIRNRSYTFAQQVNNTTEQKLKKELSEAMIEGESMREIAERMESVFVNATSVRASMIARTETIRASNGAANNIYSLSGVVEAKEWLTARDERTCAFCRPMDGKIVAVNGSFFNVGDVVSGMEGEKEVFFTTKESILYPPLHVRCRCCIIPVIYEKYLI